MSSEMQEMMEKIERIERERDQFQTERNQLQIERDQFQTERNQLQIERGQAQRQAEEQAERAEQAERLLRDTTILEFLDAAHLNLSLTITLERNKSWTTKGDLTDPTGKRIPKYIHEWSNFPQQQYELWQVLSKADPQFKSLHLFDNLNSLQVNGRKNITRKIGSEKDLEIYERYNVEMHVSAIVKQLRSKHIIAESLKLVGDVVFENHANTLSDEYEEIAQRKEEITAATPGPPVTTQSTPPMNTDQICVYNIGNGAERIPCLIVEYKAAHKLTLANIYAGLHNMNPMKDVVNRATLPAKGQEIELFVYYSERLVAAVITQTFSYMIDCGLKYGYICTGEALIFLKVPDDPQTVYYSLSVPNTHVGETTGWVPDSAEPNRLHLTAIGQILIFCLRALRERPRNQAWQANARQKLHEWKVDYNAILKSIPETERKELPSSSYKPQMLLSPPPLKWSPYFLRSRNPPKKIKQCNPRGNKTYKDENHSSDNESSDDSGDDGGFDSPSQRPNSRMTANSSTLITPTQFSQDAHQNRPYCTQRCLLGLFNKGLLDKNCPNLELHDGKKGFHSIDRITFLNRVQKQLSVSLDDGCSPWWVQGSRGAMFKVALTSHGYIVAAKGTVSVWVSALQHEEKVYNRLRPIQGVHVPVCLGSIGLSSPYFLGRGVQIIHMMFMAYGGKSINRQPHPGKNLVEQAINALKTIHHLGVLHQDALPRNMLWSEELEGPMFIDFERAEIQPIASKESLTPYRKRKWASEEDKENYPDLSKMEINAPVKEDHRFEEEVRLVMQCVGEIVEGKY